jgi:hypothetical protein
LTGARRLTRAFRCLGCSEMLTNGRRIVPRSKPPGHKIRAYGAWDLIGRCTQRCRAGLNSVASRHTTSGHRLRAYGARLNTAASRHIMPGHSHRAFEASLNSAASRQTTSGHGRRAYGAGPPKLRAGETVQAGCYDRAKRRASGYWPFFFLPPTLVSMPPVKAASSVSDCLHCGA